MKYKLYANTCRYYSIFYSTMLEFEQLVVMGLNEQRIFQRKYECIFSSGHKVRPINDCVRVCQSVCLCVIIMCEIGGRRIIMVH